jgi:hypothetical protein
VVLARLVGATGRVWACDIQATAINATAERLAAAGVADRVSLSVRDHSRWTGWLPARGLRRISLAVWNLGYLPGGDHAVATTARDTVRSLAGIEPYMAPGGRLSIMLYRGHAGAADEVAAVSRWMADQLPRYRALLFVPPDGRRPAPWLLEAVLRRDAKSMLDGGAGGH